MNLRDSRSGWTRRVRRAGVVPASLTALLAILAGSPARAETCRPTVFALGPSDLASALETFARQARIQILFPYAQARPRRSVALRGRMCPRAALRRLLAGQPLRVGTAGDDRVVLIGTTVAPARQAAAPRPRATPLPRDSEVAAVAAAAPIIVTGRASTAARDPGSYSYAVTALDLSARSSAAPVADLFRQVPGFWVEATGGEGSNNIRSRGIPTDGYTSVAMTENGLPLQYDGGLGYLNTDQSFRTDRTLSRVEIVRGGPASVFTPNAPGGVANFITRSAFTAPGGELDAVVSGDGYRRIDGAYAWRPLPDLGILLGGFYRSDNGRRPPGYRADQGGQARFGVEFRRAATRVAVDLRRLDDRVTFYLPVPFASGPGGAIGAIPGFDPLHDSLSGPELLHLRFPAATGLPDFDLTRGTRTRLTAVTLRLEQGLGAALSYAGGLRWRTSDTQRNALFPIGSPQPGALWLAGIGRMVQQAWPATDRLALRYVSDGAPVPADANGNGLVLGANVMAVHVPLDEVIGDQRLSWRPGGGHDLTLGLTLAHYAYRFARSTSTVLIDVRNGARLVDAVALDAGGRVIGGYTDHGIQRYAAQSDDAQMAVSAAALYAADEWTIDPRLWVDLGLRWEHNRIRGSVAGKTTVDLGNPLTLADDQLVRTTGARTPVDAGFSGLGWSLGISSKPRPGTDLFARLTSTFRLPSASEYNLNPTRSDQARVPIRLAEAGGRVQGRRLALSVTGFYTRFDRLPFTDYRFDPAVNSYVERSAVAGSEAVGVELEGTWQPSGWLSLVLVATVQDARYRRFAFTDLVAGAPVPRDYSGRRLIRVPAFALRATPRLSLASGRLTMAAPVSVFGPRFADVANTQRLPGYALLNLEAGWRLTDRLTWRLELSNLTNAIGLTEGNPRSGSFESANTTGYFLARPEFGRSVRVSVAAVL